MKGVQKRKLRQSITFTFIDRVYQKCALKRSFEMNVCILFEQKTALLARLYNERPEIVHDL